jgi:hypothetical protein
MIFLFVGFAGLVNRDFHTNQKFILTTLNGTMSITGFFSILLVSRTTLGLYAMIVNVVVSMVLNWIFDDLVRV